MINENMPHQNENSDTFNLRDELGKYLIHWKLFVLFSAVSLSVAHLYLRYATPQYTASTTIMIKDNQKSGISAELAAFEDLGIVGGGSSNNTDNEIIILKSRKIIGSVVDSLRLDIAYFKEGKVKKTEIYKNSPIRFTSLNKNVSLLKKDTTFVLTFIDENSYRLKNIAGDQEMVGTFNQLESSSIGDFVIVKNSKWNQQLLSTKITIRLISKERIISSYQGRVAIKTMNKNSSVISLSIVDPVKEKAEDFLNELVKQYNFDAINDKNEISRKTKDFIDERLRSVGEELSSIQDSIKDFKGKTGFTGVSNEGELILSKLSENNERVLALQVQLSLVEAVYKDIETVSDKSNFLPENLGFEDASISQTVANYNLLVSKRNTLTVNAGDKNPQLIQLRREIANYKLKLKESIRNLKNSLGLRYSELQKEQAKISAQKSTIPLIERGFIDIARQQEIIAGLYSYLLKKKEETAISLAVTVANAKIIDVAYGLNSPHCSQKKNYLFRRITPWVFSTLCDHLFKNAIRHQNTFQKRY